MSDNTQLNSGTGGDVIATDEVSTLNGAASTGVKVQRVKVLFGDDGSATDASASNPLPVTLASQPLPTGAATAAAQATGNTSLANIDADLGAQADAAATTDTGSFSVIAFIKRALQNWTTLLSRTPALGQAAMAASQPVVLASDQSVIPVNQAGVTASGSLGALNATVALSLNGATGWAVDVRGTFVGTITFQASIDGSNWTAVPVLALGSAVNVATVTTATAVGAWTGNANGCVQVRAIMTAYTSGTATVVLRAMQAAGMVYMLPAGATGLTIANVAAIAAGANAIGDVGTQYRANATGAATIAKMLTAATANPTVVKASAGRLLGYDIGNTTAAWRYVKLYNVAAAPTAGAGTIVGVIPVPPGGRAQLDVPGGIGFATGISYTTVTGSADTDATAVGAGDLVGLLYFA